MGQKLNETSYPLGLSKKQTEVWKMDRRDLLKKLGGLSAIVGGAAIVGHTTGCNDDRGHDELPWIDVRAYASLADAIMAIGLKSRALLISVPVSVAQNISIPDNVVLNFLPGGQLSIANGFTITIGKMNDPGLIQVFSCSGTGNVRFVHGAVREVYPQWWGASTDGVTDTSAAIQAAIDSVAGSVVDPGCIHPIESGGGLVVLSSGVFKIDSQIQIKEGVHLHGSSMSGSVLRYGGDDYAVLVGSQAYCWFYRIRVSNLTIEGEDNLSAKGGVRVDGAAWVDFESVCVLGFGNDTDQTALGHGILFVNCNSMSIRACYVAFNNVGIKVLRGDYVVRALSIEGATEIRRNNHGIVLGDPNITPETPDKVAGGNIQVTNSIIEGNHIGCIWNVGCYPVNIERNHFEEGSDLTSTVEFCIRVGSNDGNTSVADGGRIVGNYFAILSDKPALDFIRATRISVADNHFTLASTNPKVAVIGVSSSCNRIENSSSNIRADTLSGAIIDSGTGNMILQRGEDGKGRLAARACLSSELAIQANTVTELPLTVKTFDSGGNMTSGAYTAPMSGYYQVSASIRFKYNPQTGTQTGSQYFAMIYRDTSVVAQSAAHSSHENDVSASVSDLIEVTKGQTLKLYAWHNATGNISIDASPIDTFFSVQFTGP